MAIDFDDEILQDFLVEAGEIIDLLDGQLVDLESNPDDVELLNAIFRGFHTVKGGAGFLGIEPLVILCHRAEDVFNLLRQHDLKVTQKLMDVVLKVHDTLREMFSSINNSVEPDPADPQLIHDLESFLSPSENEDDADERETVAQTADISSSVEHIEEDNESGSNVQNRGQETADESENITDDEFEDLLDKLHGGAAPKAVVNTAEASNASVINAENSPGSENITDDEFEELLDKLHAGAAPGETTRDTEKSSVSDVETENSSVSENITDDEFESLLDHLHGKGGAW